MPRLEAIGVIVSSLDRSAAFYSHLGLRFPSPVDPEGHGHVEAEPIGGFTVMFDTRDSILEFAPSWTPPSGGHAMAPAFNCDTPAGVDAMFTELIEAGGSAHKEPWDAVWGMRYAQVRDPDGNVVDLYAPLPK